MPNLSNKALRKAVFGRNVPASLFPVHNRQNRVGFANEWSFFVIIWYESARKEIQPWMDDSLKMHIAPRKMKAYNNSQSQH